MRKSFFIFLTGILSVFNAAAKPFYTTIPELTSISKGTIYAMTQDENGALWFGTNYGVYRYNGVELEVISKDITEHPFATCLYSNSFYYQCNGYIVKIDATNRKRNIINTNFNIYSVATFGDSVIACDRKNVYIESGDTLKKWINVSPDKGKIRLLKSTSSGRIFCSIGAGKLYEIINGDLVFRTDVCDEICEIYEDKLFRLWVGLNSKGIKVYSRDFLNSFDFHPKNNLKNARKFRTFIEDNDGNMFAGCLDGLFYISPDGKSKLTNTYSPDGFAICSLLKDTSENIWIGSFYGGVFLCEKNVSPFSNIEISPLSQPRISTGLVEDSHGNMWLATDKSGLFCFPKNGGPAILIPGSEDMKIKNAWYDINENAIWLSLYLQPFSKYDIQKGKWTQYNYTSDKGLRNNTSGFHIIKNGDDFWIAGSDEIYLFDKNKEQAIARTLPEYKGHPRNLRLQPDGSVYICGNGLHKWKDGHITKLFDHESKLCFDVFQNRDKLYIGTNSGLYCCDLDGNVLGHFEKENTGLEDNFVYSILPINSEMLLLGTNNGISFFDINKAECFNYSTRNGLSLSSVQEGCIMQRMDGTIWIAGTDGISSINPQNIRLPKNNPKITIDKILVNGNEIPLDTKISLSHKENNLSFKTSTYDYARIIPLFCQCRLLPYEKEWKTYNIETPIVYLGLKSGKYTMEFRAVRNQIGAEVINSSTIGFRIRHPWYWSPVAWAIYILILFFYARWQVGMISEYRARKRVRLAKDVSIVAQNDSDTDFIRQTEKIINDHISDSNLSVELLCHDLGIGYQVFSSRIKGLTGYSPRDFIEFIRMRKASTLLLDKNMNISNVAFDVGFNSSQYFATRFKKHFGMTPSEYINSMTNFT